MSARRKRQQQERRDRPDVVFTQVPNHDCLPDAISDDQRRQVLAMLGPTTLREKRDCSTCQRPVGFITSTCPQDRLSRSYCVHCGSALGKAESR